MSTSATGFKHFYLDESLVGHLFLRPSIWMASTGKRIVSPLPPKGAFWEVVKRIFLSLGLLLAALPSTALIPPGLLIKGLAKWIRYLRTPSFPVERRTQNSTPSQNPAASVTKPEVVIPTSGEAPQKAPRSLAYEKKELTSQKTLPQRVVTHLQESPLPKLISTNEERKKALKDLPFWMPKFLSSAPCVSFPDTRRISFEDLSKTPQTPLVLFSGGNTTGILMRLKVTHICVDPSYDRTNSGPTFLHGYNFPSTSESFILPVALWVRYKFPKDNDNLHVLSSPQEVLKHRNGAYFTGSLPIDGLTMFNDKASFSEEEESQLSGVEKEGELPLIKKSVPTLPWVLLRLLSGQPILLSERRTDRLYHSPQDALIGYWKMSLT